MIDIENEDLLTLALAAKHLPNGRAGKSVHVATLHRWAANGAQGVKLETVKIGGIRFTSVQALERFVEACTAGNSEAPVRTSKARQRDIDKADRELVKAGIG